jgi:predicted O-methyltransferase YrrM
MGAAVKTVLQDEQEISAFADIIRRDKVRSFLEIGSKFGGALRIVAAGMPAGSKIVAVDLPRGTRAWPESEAALNATIADLQAAGHDAQVIWGDSTNATVIEQVRRLGPYDAIFIDANHTLPFVSKDWENYGPMGRIVAFHDIAWRRMPEWKEGTRIDVPLLWDRIKGGFRHEEIKYCPTGKNNGIGVLWRD